MRETIHMPEKQVKSKQRVADHGEVFTAERTGGRIGARDENPVQQFA